MTLPFIGREPQLTELKHLINAKQGALFVITGKSGMGKSTLLRHIADIYANKGQSFIDINDVPPLKTAVEFLAHLAQQARNLTETQKALTKIDGTYKNKADLISPYKEVLTQATQMAVDTNSLELTPEETGKITQLAKVALQLSSIIAKNRQEKAKEKLSDPELVLLTALKKDCQKQPLIFIDTYERLQAAQELSQQKISSRYSKLNQHLTAAPAQLSLQDWLDNFIDFLIKNGAIVIIAGRKAGHWQTKARSLEQFNDDDIINLISCSDYANLQALLGDEQAQQALLSLLNRLSFNGIPLWLQLALNFVSLELANDCDIIKLAQTSSIESLFAMPETESELDSINTDNARCKLALFKRVMQHNLDLEELAWQMALPRRLTKPILTILFADKANLLRDSFIKAGLLSPLRLETDSTRLHDEIRDLLLSYARYKGWLELEKTKNLHKQLADFFAQQYQLTKDLQFFLEQLYHQLNSEEQFNLEPINDADVLVNMAIVLETEKQYQKMSQVFLRLIDIEPDYNNAWFGLGIALDNLDKLEQSLEAYLKQIAIKPNHEQAWDNLGDIYVKQNKLELAIEAYLKQIAIKPNHEWAWNGLGIVYAKQDKLELAIEAYLKQIAIKPNHEYAWNGLGYIYYKQNKLELAIEAYLKQIAIKPNHEYAWDNLGDIYVKQNKLEQAIEAYLKQIAIKPNHESAWDNLGDIYAKQDKLELAIEAYLKQIAIKPNHESAWNNLGIAYWKQGDLNQAQQAYQKALEINPKDTSALSNDAELALIKNDKERCLQRIATASALIDNKDDFYVILPFLAWLAEPEKPSIAIDEAIEKLHKDVKITWDFTDTEPAILRLTPEQQFIARQYITYFQGAIINNISS